MDINSIQEGVIAITSKTLNIDVNKISPDSNFAEHLGADSLDQVELIMEIEREFTIDIPDVDASKITTITEAVKYIHSKLSPTGSAAPEVVS